MKKSKLHISFLSLSFFLATILFLSPQPAEAINIGKFELLTDIFIEETYDDNILLDPNKKSDLITTISPTVSLTRTGAKMYFDLSYNARLRYYDKDPNQNQRSQTGTLNIGIKPTPKSNIGIRGQDTYSYIRRDERDPNSVTGNLIKYNDFLINPYIEQGIGKKFKTSFSYLYTGRKYKQVDKILDEDLEDSESHTGSTDFQYRLGDNTSLNGGYKYTSTDFARQTTDYTEHEATAGFIWGIDTKIRLSGGYGHAWRIQNEDESNQKSNYPTINSRLDIYFIKDTIITAGYTRSSAYISSYDTENDSFISHDASLNISHNLLNQKVILTYGAGYNLSDYDPNDREDKSYNGTLNITWRIMKPLLVSLNGNYIKSDYLYNSSDRNDKSCAGLIGLEWEIFKPLTLSLTGGYTKLKYNTDYSERTENERREDDLYEISSMLSVALNQNIFFEVGYQYLENKSVDKRLQQHLENNEYINNKYHASLRITF